MRRDQAAGAGPVRTHAGEPHFGGFASRLNWLRAGVLGANDGIVSVAGIVIGVSEQTARIVAEELTRHDAFAADVDVELGIDPSDLTNPWHAALASAAIIGSLLPLIAILAPPATWRVPVTFVAVLAALAVTGEVSARLGGTGGRPLPGS